MPHDLSSCVALTIACILPGDCDTRNTQKHTVFTWFFVVFFLLLSWSQQNMSAAGYERLHQCQSDNGRGGTEELHPHSGKHGGEEMFFLWYCTITVVSSCDGSIVSLERVAGSASVVVIFTYCIYTLHRLLLYYSANATLTMLCVIRKWYCLLDNKSPLAYIHSILPISYT